MKAVIFDLDNTLFDHTASATYAIRSWVPELGGTPSDELVAQWFVIEDRNYDQWLAGALTHQGQRRGRLRDFLPLIGHPVPPTDAELDQLFTGLPAPLPRRAGPRSRTPGPRWKLPAATVGGSAC